LIAAVLPRDDRGIAAEEVRSNRAKRCPDCAEIVLVEARKCKHCGYLFESKAASGAREKTDHGEFDRAVTERRDTRFRDSEPRA
jgi:hypothetical protein